MGIKSGAKRIATFAKALVVGAAVTAIAVACSVTFAPVMVTAGILAAGAVGTLALSTLAAFGHEEPGYMAGGAIQRPNPRGIGRSQAAQQPGDEGYEPPGHAPSQTPNQAQVLSASARSM